MRYSVRHVTRFAYDTPIAESVMEARMQPRTDGAQRCLHFALTTSPGARVMTYQDHEGNCVHFFDIPPRHSRLTLTAEAVVESAAVAEVPPSLGPAAWDELDAAVQSGELWEYVAPSPFAFASEALKAFSAEIDFQRGDDPLALLHTLTGELYRRFEYRPKSTRVDSPIDEALDARCGVCQDFAHIFIALARSVGIPARYVSGYLFRDVGANDRSADGATHAWVEAFLPPLGWIGFDPTNNIPAGERHIRVAIGRDYADVPPTRGVYKGASAVRTELAVAVRIGAQPSPGGDTVPFTPWMSRDASAPMSRPEEAQEQQQQ